jgi:hypothetical protein
MALVLLIAVSVGMIASLVPFLVPGTLLAVFGDSLNDWLGGLLAGLGVAPGHFVTETSGGATLTLAGVLTVYVPLLLVLTILQRRR